MSEKPQQEETQFPEKLERPVECSECQRPIAVHYSKIVNGEMTHLGMCNQCPQLRLKLYGTERVEKVTEFTEKKTGLACGECGTTLESVQMGSPLGCSTCYDVFSETLIHQLFENGRLSKKPQKKGRTQPLHLGRSPGEVHEMSPSIRILALNEALDETLKKENYEQAALLRDQIKALTEQQEKNGDSIDKKT